MDNHFDDAVPALLNTAETGAELAQSLMMIAVGHDASAIYIVEKCAGQDLCLMVFSGVVRVIAVAGAERLGQILNERAAKADVDHLAALADAEHWLAGISKPVEESELNLIQSAVDAAAPLVLLMKEGGIDVRSAGQNQRVVGVRVLRNLVGTGIGKAKVLHGLLVTRRVLCFIRNQNFDHIDPPSF